MTDPYPITAARKRRFAETLLVSSRTPVGFVDIGSGGALKAPWTLLSPNQVRKFNFEPEESRAGAMPLCVSDHVGRERLFVARDLRSSSLHRAAKGFIQRFENPSITATREMEIDCVTLDSFLAGRQEPVDLLDVNTEGHDFRVIRGASELLARGSVSLIKVEMLFTEVWQGQGWFSDIDQFLREAGYDIVTLDLDFDRPGAVRHLHHGGELLWGKALYVPSADAWRANVDQPTDAVEDRVIKAIVLYVIADAIGRAVELATLAERAGVLRRIAPDVIGDMIRKVFHYAEVEARTQEVLRALNLRRWAGAIARLVASR